MVALRKERQKTAKYQENKPNKKSLEMLIRGKLCLAKTHTDTLTYRNTYKHTHTHTHTHTHKTLYKTQTTPVHSPRLKLKLS